MMRWISLVLILAAFANVSAQELKVLSDKDVLNIVRANHPVVKLAQITTQKADAELLDARGAFDPTIGAYAAEKIYEGTKYYNSVAPELKIPTWFGVDIYAGTQYLTGQRVDPSETKGESNYMGVSIPLAKNLLFDSRRAALQQAKVYQDIAATEQLSMVNDILMGAMDAYWKWVEAFENLKMIQNAIHINEKRLDFVNKSVEYGELADIDSTEALTQLQSFQYRQGEYNLKFIKAALDLSAYLWTENNLPYDFGDEVQPPTNWDQDILMPRDISLENLLNRAIASHPELALYNFRLVGLDIEKRLKFQGLLPTIDFRYNILNSTYNVFDNLGARQFENNYQYGLKVAIPLFLREGRAQYQLAKLKIEETKQNRSLKSLEAVNKVKYAFMSYETYENQSALMRDTYKNYNALVNAEERKFENGESSLFLINIRENKALDALEKWNAARTKFLRSIYYLEWSVGGLR